MEMRHGKKKKKSAVILCAAGKVMLFVLTFALCVTLTLFLAAEIVCGTSDASRKAFTDGMSNSGYSDIVYRLGSSSD